jgi:hypothetical protein
VSPTVKQTQICRRRGAWFREGGSRVKPSQIISGTLCRHRLGHAPPFQLHLRRPKSRLLYIASGADGSSRAAMQSTSTMNLCSRGPQLRLRNVQPARISRSAAASSCTTARVVSAPAVSRTFGSSRRQLAIRASGPGIAHPGEVGVQDLGRAWRA